MTRPKIRVGIVGISGYSGRELLRLLLDHPSVEVAYVSANKTAGPVDKIWPQFAGKTKLVCGPYDEKAAAAMDTVFLATPHTVSMKLAPALLEKGVKVIDMSGDFRLSSEEAYTQWYAAEEHEAPHLLEEAVYGLPELYRDDVAQATLLANPGCYPTASILAAAPLAEQEIISIHIDAKSGVSGAGIAKTEALLKQMQNNFKAYKVLRHQHGPEIAEQLEALAAQPLRVAFVPHLLPIERGIFATVYVSLAAAVEQAEAQALFETFYKDAPFVKVVPGDTELELKDVVGTNDLQLRVTANPDQKLLVVTAVLDNLIKGASGQAVQNFNLMHGLGETEGLK